MQICTKVEETSVSAVLFRLNEFLPIQSKMKDDLDVQILTFSKCSIGYLTKLVGVPNCIFCRNRIDLYMENQNIDYIINKRK